MALLIVDVHAHLDFPDYELDIAEVLRVNKDAGVAAVVCNGVGPESNRRVLEISKSYDIARPALGIYPTHATELSESDFFDEVDFIRKQSICAIGEVGLDYPKSADLAVFSTKKAVMKQRFEALLEAAEKKNIPVIVHSRRAEADTIQMLESSSIKKVVMHCFMGRKPLVKRVLDNGWSISIPCIVSRSEQLQENVKLAPTSQLLTETDAPYMSPFDDVKRNEPRFIKHSIAKIAQLKGLNPEEASNIIFQNYSRLFS